MVGKMIYPDPHPKGYEVEYHIATNVEVNPRIISALKDEKSI